MAIGPLSPLDAAKRTRMAPPGKASKSRSRLTRMNVDVGHDDGRRRARPVMATSAVTVLGGRPRDH